MMVNLKTKILKRFFEDNGISHNFSCPRTPQQNGVLVRKNILYKKWPEPRPMRQML